MNSRKILLPLFFLIFFIQKSKSQNHNFSVLGGYAISSATAPDGSLSLGSDGLSSQGQDFFDFKNGFQLGVLGNIDIGYDLYHLDVSLQYGKYGFIDVSKIDLNYLDLDIGVSNFNSDLDSRFVYGGGITPSLLLSSNNIENTNNFDLRVYAKLGYKLSSKLTLYSQFRYSFLKLVPDSGINNLQISFNLAYSLLKI